MMIRYSSFLLSACCVLAGVGAFAPSATKLNLSSAVKLSVSKKSVQEMKEANSGNLAESIFKGGMFGDEDPIPEAVKIASKIKSLKDLGWTQPPKRAGNTRPRHRAWGGESEKPVQLKANYDESNEMCVEKWLTKEEFDAKTRSSGPAADAVFVALAGGAAYAERDNVESLLAAWRDGRNFNEAAFVSSVKKGQSELLTGWAFFIGLNAFFASCIVFPTNPANKFFEAALESLLRG